MKKENNIISDWLDQNGDPEIEKYIENNLAITEKIRIALEQRGWKALDLAKAMNKSPSEVSKWLSGTHNLTLKSMTKLEIALNIDLINIRPDIQYVYLGTIKGGELQEAIDDYEETTYAPAI